ncbi:farnesol dehydrogenase-like isoform X3 [Periplaneta americana]|uniref:farnesol dehydrogenase-like isoform X3 n=1 Tax=Periplaneta americana TaxID=6978 RepID=UPI0037E9BD89
MERWSGRVALVTGASSGIGAELATQLVKSGLQVVGIARRVENIEKLAQNLQNEPGNLHPVKADITCEEEVKAAFAWVQSNLGGVDILVNCAGADSINTLIGHSIPDINFLSIYMYSAAEHAVTVLTEGLRRELLKINSKIRISSVSPGLVKTDFFSKAGNSDELTDLMYQTNPYLETKDVVDAIVYILGTPPHVQIHELIIKPTGEKY